MKLRDALLDALGVLPAPRRFHLHVLVSAPRKHTSLFPYATPRPRVYAQDILVLCSEQKDGGSPRILVSAIEAAVYNVPASDSALFYVSKVDSTGQGARPSPTAALVRALLSFYVSPWTRPLAAAHLWVHVFARAQAQYLFPNSAEHPGKRPLGDVRLCAWWKRVYTQVAREAMGARDAPAPRLYYVLPGMDELEAKQALGELSVAALSAERDGGPQWTYGHPYAQTDVAPPCPGDARHNLGLLIPSFDDDPKSRFLDEIACTTQVDGLRSPKRKRTRTSVSVRDRPQTGGGSDGDGDEGAGQKGREERVPGELGLVSADEFWERMSFRQECVAGAVTGFFVAVYSWPSDGAQGPSSLAPHAGEVSFQLVRRVVASLLTGHDFSTTERALRATAVLEGAIRGLCASSVADTLHPAAEPGGDEGRTTPGRPGGPGASPRTPPRRLGRTDSRGAGVADGAPSAADTYDDYIYGAVAGADAGVGPGAQGAVAGGGDGRPTGTAAVTVLAARKKRR